jgi:hypothetical protein
LALIGLIVGLILLLNSHHGAEITSVEQIEKIDPSKAEIR